MDIDKIRKNAQYGQYLLEKKADDENTPVRLKQAFKNILKQIEDDNAENGE